MPSDSTAADTDRLWDEFVALPPFGVAPEQKRERLLAALQAAYRHHWAACPAYRRTCERRGFTATTTFASLEDLPWLPAAAFKGTADLLRSVPGDAVHTQLASSATSGVASTVPIDRVTAKRQVRALAAVLGAVLGARRRPFLVLDVDPRTASLAAVGARGAAVRGFLNLAREAAYFLRATPDGHLALETEIFLRALTEVARRGEPVVLFGFTFVLYAHVLRPWQQEGRRWQLPPGSQVVHIGGWKKLADQQVSKEALAAAVAQVFGLGATDVHDFYGFTEQLGVTYPDAPDGDKITPVFADVLVRDPASLLPVPDGTPGLLQFVTPLPTSYPGISVLTDDLGVVTARNGSAAGWQGTRFRVLGRAAQAEVRGCGDIMGEKFSSPGLPPPGSAGPGPGQPRLLFDGAGTYTPVDFTRNVQWQDLPPVPDLDALAAKLRVARARLDAYSVDEIAMLLGAAAQRWIQADSPLAPLRTIGLLFLASWCQPAALRRLADQALRGARGHLEGFVPVDGFNRRLLHAVPRGLVVHWLAGNVPLLGMLGLVQSLLARNANLLKASRSFAGVLPALLSTFRGLTVTTPAGRTLRGDDLLAAVAVVYFPPEDRASATQLSQLADLRLAWGGREAVEAILHLPRRYGTEEIIFGPKLSYMVVGREGLDQPRVWRRIVRGAAIDASVFDQYACASPHTIFVECLPGADTARRFAAALADEMARAAIRLPKAPVDPGTAAKILALRLRHELTGELWTSRGTEWTVLYDEGPPVLSAPCYSRVISVRPVADVMLAADLAHSGIQTVGLALEGARRLEFAARAARRGVERFPDIGRMTYFDAPWDGLYPLDRMVRWVSLGGPF
ncbi:MAG: acyl-CoA reductase [Verrucomicrobia bacterium]|nr:acyl-CoA reductase [Verrucomicrobiota bacterium]